LALDIHTDTFQIKCGTGTQSITAPGFTPKVIIFQLTDQTCTGTAANAFEGIGWTAGTGACDEFAQSTAFVDGTKCGNRRISKSAILLINASATVLLDAGLNSFDTCGFTICIATNCGSVNTIVRYTAIGGSCLTNVKVNCFCFPCTTGCNTVSCVGFQADTILAMPFICQTTFPSNSNKGFYSWGVVDRVTGNEWSMSGVRKAECGMTGKITTDLCGTNFLGNAKKPNCFCGQANFVSAATCCGGRFIFNVTDAPMNAGKAAYLALEYCLTCVCTTVSTFNKSTSTCVPVTQNVTAPGFQADFGMFISSSAAVGTSNVNVEYSVGMTDFTNENSSAITERDGTCNCKDMTVKTDKVLTLLDAGCCAAAALTSEADATTNACGFTFTWTTNDANAHGIGYWILKGAAAGLAIVKNAPTSTVGLVEARNRLGSLVRNPTVFTVALNEASNRLKTMVRNTTPFTVAINEASNRLKVIGAKVIDFTVGLTEASNRLKAEVRNTPTATVGLNESSNRLGSLVRNIDFTVGLTEASNRLKTMVRNVTVFTVGITETSNRLKSMVRNVPTFTVGITEVNNFVKGLVKNVVTSIVGLTEASNRLGSLVRNINFTVGLTETPNRLMTMVRNVTTFTVGITETSNRLKSMVRNTTVFTVGLTEVNNRVRGLVRNVTTSIVGLTEVNNFVKGIVRNVATATVGLVEASNRLGSLVRNTTTFTVGLTETRNRLESKVRNINFTVGLNESSNRLMTMVRNVPTATVGLTELVNRVLTASGAIIKVITSTVGITEVNNRLGSLVRNVNFTVGLLESSNRLNRLVRNVTTATVGLIESINKVSGIVRVVTTSIVGLVETSNRLGIKVRNISSTVGLNEVNNKVMSLIRNIVTTVGLNETSNRLKTMVRNIPTSTIGLTEVNNRALGFVKVVATSTLGLIETVNRLLSVSIAPTRNVGGGIMFKKRKRQSKEDITSRTQLIGKVTESVLHDISIIMPFKKSINIKLDLMFKIERELLKKTVIRKAIHQIKFVGKTFTLRLITNNSIILKCKFFSKYLRISFMKTRLRRDISKDSSIDTIVTDPQDILDALDKLDDEETLK